MRSASSLSAMRGTAPKSSDACSTVTVERVGDREAAVLHLERLAVVAAAAARVAGDEDVGQEVHLDAQHAVALAGLAAPALHVEREAPRLVAAGARVGQAGVEIAQEREDAGVRRGVRARRAADGRLVDRDDLVDVLEPLDAVALADRRRRVVELRARGRQQRVDDEARLAAAADAGDAGEEADRDLGRHVRAGCARARRRRGRIAFVRALAASTGRGAGARR